MQPGNGHRIGRPSRLQRRRVLIVADAHCTERRRCPQRWRKSGNAPVEALVVAPAHETSTTGWVVDESAVLGEAQRSKDQLLERR